MIRRNYSFSVTLFLLLALSSSCRAPKDVAYFQGINDLTEEQKKAMNQLYVPRIHIDDILIINVTSPTREATAPYSPAPFGYYEPGEEQIGISAQTQNLYTYLVDDKGDINFPVLGRVKIAGYSINEANMMMEELIKPSVPDVLVNIQITNFKVGIFGEVKNADTYAIKSTRISILDLIAMAGDLTINGDRKNILLIRDNDGEKEYKKLDITDPAIFASPYYYLQHNDLVYVEPNDARKRFSKYTEQKTYNASMIATLTTTVSILVTVFVTIRGQYINR
jgi:polysaccharide export outer membrane protein